MKSLFNSMFDSMVAMPMVIGLSIFSLWAATILVEAGLLYVADFLAFVQTCM